ncbi:MAG: P-loop NTPase [Chlamydiales bacterium]|nr:P-loop NTPase [Chlamydiales bacterium]
MTNIITLCSFRGGTGKSCIGAALGKMLSDKGYRTCLIDADFESPNLGQLVGVKDNSKKNYLNNFLEDSSPIKSAAYPIHSSENYYLLLPNPSASSILKMQREGTDLVLLSEGYEEIIKELNLDFLVIDNHTGINEHSLLSISHANLCLVITETHHDNEGTEILFEIAKKLDVKKIHLIVNKITQNCPKDELRRQYKESYESHISFIPFTSRILEEKLGQWLNQSTPFVHELESILKQEKLC